MLYFKPRVQPIISTSKSMKKAPSPGSGGAGRAIVVAEGSLLVAVVRREVCMEADCAVAV